MGFPILVRRHLYIESGPWWHTHCILTSETGDLQAQHLPGPSRLFMMTSWHGNTFHITGHLCRESLSLVDSLHKGPMLFTFDDIFFVSLNNIFQQTVEFEMVWDVFIIIWRHCSVISTLHKKPRGCWYLDDMYYIEWHCVMNHYVAMGMEPQVVIFINSVPWHLVRFH